MHVRATNYMSMIADYTDLTCPSVFSVEDQTNLN